MTHDLGKMAFEHQSEISAKDWIIQVLLIVNLAVSVAAYFHPRPIEERHYETFNEVVCDHGTCNKPFSNEFEWTDWGQNP